VDIYLEARAILSQKIFETMSSIDSFKQQKLETAEQIKKHQREERLNSYGIMYDSVLVVNELELANQKNAHNRKLYIEVICEGTSVKSVKKVYRQGIHWDKNIEM
jgi:hypothetical protein